MTRSLKKHPVPWPTLWFAIIVLAYLALGGLYALYTPPWQAPDEPAHFNYIRYVAEEGRLPELTVGDYPVEYLEEIKAHRFAAGWAIDPLRYEAHQPPLYYLGGALVYRLAKPWGMPNLLYALRFFSVLIGAAGLGVGYGVARRLAPSRPVLALGAVAFAATLPMHIAMTSAVNNDGLAELMVGLVVWAIVGLRWEAWTVRRAVGIGALLGLAFLTKMQSNIAFGLALGALAWDAYQARKQGAPRVVRHTLTRAGAMLGMAFLIALPWLWRNAHLYGLTDLLALGRHDTVVTGQLMTRTLLGEIGWRALLWQGLHTTFQSFWGQFGWMGVPLDGRIYFALRILSFLALVGVIGRLVGSRGLCAYTPERRRRAALLLLWAGLTVLGYLWYNLKYVQHQGRYLFPAIIPWGFAFTWGLEDLLQKHALETAVGLALAALGVAVISALQGDVKGYAVAILAISAAAVMGGHALARWRAEVPFVLLYGGMALFSAACLFLWVVPNLRP